MDIGRTSWFQYGSRNNYITSRDAYTNRQGMVQSYNRAKQDARGKMLLEQGGMGRKFMDQRSMERMLSENAAGENDAGRRIGNIVSESLGYADRLSTARTDAKNTALEIKKLKYDFKKISSQILRSKTSYAARQVAGKARREVLYLQRQKQSGVYDEEELQSAIAHAKAMERVAKKKARHLWEEELAKIGGRCLAELEERKEENPAILSRDKEVPAKELLSATADDRIPAMTEEEMFAATDEKMPEMSEMTDAMMSAMTEEMTEELWESMEKLMEDTSLEEWMEELGGDIVAQQDMDPADLKMMKIKHRSEELKAMAKADGEYLKAMFEHYEEIRSAMLPGGAKESLEGTVPGSFMASGTGNIGFSENAAVVLYFLLKIPHPHK